MVQEDFKNQYAGVGLKVSLEPETNTMVVTDVYAGSPAEKAGIKTLDEILKINGKSVSVQNNNELLDEMRGKAGHRTVELELQRAETKET